MIPYKPAQPRPRGRPKGSKNKVATEVALTPELLRLKTMLQVSLKLMLGVIPLTHLALDGHFGNHAALAMVRQCLLHLVSKLRSDSALYFAYDGPYCGHGAHRKYGAKLDYQNLLPQYLKTTTSED